MLIDAPPVLPVSDAMAISARADGMVVVARLDVVQKPVLRELRRELDGAHVHRLGLVLTGAESEASYGYGWRGTATATARAPSLPGRRPTGRESKARRLIGGRPADGCGTVDRSPCSEPMNPSDFLTRAARPEWRT